MATVVCATLSAIVEQIEAAGAWHLRQPFRDTELYAAAR
jgi:hypothetical protein